MDKKEKQDKQRWTIQWRTWPFSVWKTVVLFLVISALSQSLLLSEPSQLPSQLLTGILNQQLMCSKICLPPHGPKGPDILTAHTYSSCLLAACSNALPPIPQQSFGVEVPSRTST